MDVKEYASIAEIEDIWNRIYSGNEDISWFQSFSWNQSLEWAFRNRKVRYRNCTLKYIVYDGRFIVPAVVSKKENYIEFLGTKESSDYLSFIYDWSASQTELSEWVRFFLEDYAGYSIRLERINVTSRIYGIVKEVVAHSNGAWKEELRDCVVVPTRTDSETFVASLSKSARQNYRTALNRIRKDGLQYEVTSGFGTVSEEIAAMLLTVYRDRRADCDEANNVAGRAAGFARGVIKKALGENDIDILSDYSRKEKLFLALIRIDGELAAFCEGNLNNRQNCISIARVATKSDYYKYSPGNIMLIETIEKLKNEIEFFDLTRGIEDYKFRLGGVIHHNACFYLN